MEKHHFLRMEQVHDGFHVVQGKKNQSPEPLLIQMDERFRLATHSCFRMAYWMVFS